MLYLLDANVLITANAQYYEIGRVPEFWAWLQHQGTGGSVRIPKEIYEEITVGRGDLPAWLKQTDVKSALLLPEDVDPADVAEVINLGYAPDLTDDEIEQLGRDPFLIAYARVDAAQRCVVTTEVSRPRTIRQNRRVPDVCATLGVSCINVFDFVRQLDFRTDWDQ